MSRKIWFRAIASDTKKWIYGLPCAIMDGVPTAMELRTEENKIRIQRVDPKTICQKISIFDFECYEGDLVKTPRGVGVVQWNRMDGRYEIILQNGEIYYFNSAFNDLLEVVGNILENPEIMEGSDGTSCH